MTDSGPLIIQSDSSILLDVHSSFFEEARDGIAPFAELIKSPEHIHTYKISPLSLWNAASAGLRSKQILDILGRYARYAIPGNVSFFITDTISRFGKLVMKPSPDENRLLLAVSDSFIIRELTENKRVSPFLEPCEEGFSVRLVDRGTLKQELLRIGYPVNDEAELSDGDHLAVGLRSTCLSGRKFVIRDYQKEAAASFYGAGKPGNGYGTVVLPCGSGKTIVGIAVMEILSTCTLIITTNVAAVHQWIDELLDKTTLDREQIGEYTGDKKIIKPVTIATYQILTWRPDKSGDFPHFSLFRKQNWGLIIYDEVHLLPAPVFRVTAEIQAMRRLGLTATLVREDGREADVFSLVGPKRYDVPWKELERKGWIAEAYCHEIRIDLDEESRLPYITADKRRKYRIASENPRKTAIAKQLAENHKDDSILIIGQYLAQLGDLAKEFDAPLITGATPNAERERIYADFRSGKVQLIIVSKVANFAIDLPDASVAIQVSGSFGSRQEEAQRLGRILRPKEKNSYFYSIISRQTSEEDFALNRQKFLTEQGYKYHIEVWE
ncbi:MAG: DEAD/DEAH box helicase [Spirochaetales bacterium]|nr:DEAD/DEAH box helicase [Spirochaetales bacterium]